MHLLPLSNKPNRMPVSPNTKILSLTYQRRDGEKSIKSITPWTALKILNTIERVHSGDNKKCKTPSKTIEFILDFQITKVWNENIDSR